jgi:hypothetical protein
MICLLQVLVKSYRKVTSTVRKHSRSRGRGRRKEMSNREGEEEDRKMSVKEEEGEEKKGQKVLQLLQAPPSHGDSWVLKLKLQALMLTHTFEHNIQ